MGSVLCAPAAAMASATASHPTTLTLPPPHRFNPCLPRPAPTPPPTEVEDSGANSSPDFLASLLQQSYRVERPGTGEMRHGTEGWKCLETSFRVRLGGEGGCSA